MKTSKIYTRHVTEHNVTYYRQKELASADYTKLVLVAGHTYCLNIVTVEFVQECYFV